MTTTPTTADRLGGTAAESALSDADGPTDVPLLEETIGDNFDRIVATNGARDALVECATGRRWTYAQLGTDVDTLALGLIRRGIERATESASGRPTTRNGLCCNMRQPRSGRSSCASTRHTGLPSCSTFCSSPAYACSSPRRRPGPSTTRR